MQPSTPAHAPLAIALIGRGAIGKHLERLIAEHAPALAIIGAIHRDEGSEPPEISPLLQSADIFVECASVAAVSEWAPRILGAGKPLLITSIGALASPALRAELEGLPGRYWLTSGAIGGLDLIRAAALSGGLNGIRITTTKRTQAFDPTLVAGLGEAKRTIFEGSPEEAIEQFPATANVTVALALAAPGVPVEVRVVADGSALRTQHEVQAWGSSGEYRFNFDNEVNPENPKSSGLTARSLLSALLSFAASTPSGAGMDPAVRMATRFL